MKNEQYDEIVEKVWKMNKMGMSGNDFYELVNSWQGLGRTVQAMAGNNIIIEIFAKHYTDYLRGAINEKQFWERTHLATLEALK